MSFTTIVCGLTGAAFWPLAEAERANMATSEAVIKSFKRDMGFLHKRSNQSNVPEQPKRMPGTIRNTAGKMSYR
jgi:hypothetical protein